MKKTLKKISSSFLCILLLFSLSILTASAEDSDLESIHLTVTYGQSEARTMLDMVNEFRLGNEAWAWNEDNSQKVYYTDLDELVYDYELEQIAMQRAAEIALSFSHTRPNGKSCFSLYNSYYNAGENIAAGYATASDVFEGWKETDDDYSGQGHRRNMLNSSFKAIGIGHAYVNGTHYWVQEFRNPASSLEEVPANDSKTDVSVDILLSDTEVSVTSDVDKMDITVGQTADLPVLNTTIRMSNAWPARDTTVTTDYVWSVADTQYASVSGNTITGMAPGTTTLTTTTLGKTISIPLTISEVSIKAPVISSVYSTVQTAVKVTWSKVDEADGYELWRSTAPEGDFTLTKTIKDRDAVKYTNQGLEIGQTYYYKVRSYLIDGNGNTVYSDFSDVRHMPAAVTFDNVYSNSTSRIRLLWNAVDGADGYQIWRADSSNGTYTIVKTISSGSTTAYSNTGLTSGNTYYYKVRAFTKENDQMIFGVFSDISETTVMPESPVFTVTSSDSGKVSLNWKQVNGARGYQIWRCNTEDGTYQIIKSITDGSTISYTNSGLIAGETYYYKMRSYTEINGKKTFSPYSEIKSVEVKK